MAKKLIETDEEKIREYKKGYEVTVISKFDILHFLENDANFEEIEQKYERFSNKNGGLL